MSQQKPERHKSVPLRQCVGCRSMKEKKELVRILRTDAGEFVLDMGGRQNGRGAYICRDRECLARAIKTKGLERSFKMQIPVSVYDNLKEEFDR